MATRYTAGKDYEVFIKSLGNSGRYATASEALRAVVLEGLDSGGAKELEPAELVELTEPAELVELTEPAELVELTEPAELVELTEPAELVESAESAKARGRGRLKARKDAG